MYRQRIIEEAARLFITQGVRLVTMDDIAKRLGISKRTIYEHFKDKRELIVSVLEYLHLQKVDENEKIFTQSNNVLEALLELLKQSRGSVQRQTMRMMIEVKRYYPDTLDDDKWDEGVQKIEQVFAKGVEEGVFRTNLNIKTSAYMFSEQARILFTELSEKIDFPAGSMDMSSLQFMQDLFMNFLRGISTQKGIEIIEKFISTFFEGHVTATN